MSIIKSTFSFSVLHDSETEITNLSDAIYEASEGAAVGSEGSVARIPISPDNVVPELLAMGNDGAFFDQI